MAMALEDGKRFFRSVMFFSLLFLPIAPSVSYADTPTPSNGWGIGMASDAQEAQCGNGPHYSSAGAAIAVATSFIGPLKLDSVSTVNNAHHYNFSIRDHLFSPMPACNLVATVGVGYELSNTGTACMDGSYALSGASCPPYAPSPKLLGKPCCQQNVGKQAVGEPIEAASGNVFEEAGDYTTAGINTLAFTRYYNSLAVTTYANTLGSNWRHNYDRYINVQSSTLVYVERPDGQVLGYTLSGGVWTGSTDVDIALTHSGSGTGSTWTLKDSNDTTETYTQLASGECLLNSIVYRDGYTQTVNRNGSSQITSVSDSFSRSLVFTYTNGLLTTVTTPGGLVLTYAFNSSGLNGSVPDRLLSVSYSTSPAKNQTYSYTASGLPFALTGITDENGSLYTSWTYDSFGRGTSSQRGSGADLTNISYVDWFLLLNYEGGPIVTSASGQSEKYRYLLFNGIPKLVEIDRITLPNVTIVTASETFGYDSSGYLNKKTDWNGRVIDYSNDTHGQPLTITEEGDVANPNRVTTLTYDTTWVHLPKHIVTQRKTTDFTYDASGNMLTRTETDNVTTGNPTRTWTYTYDTFGRNLTAKGPRTDINQTTTYTWSGNTIATVTDALGHTSTINSYNGSGLPLSMTDPNGVVNTFTYDTRDRLLTRTVQGAAGNAVTTFAYDAAGNTSQITLPDSSFLAYSYDTAHRMTQVQDNVYNRITYAYDANGDVTQRQVLNSTGTIVKTQSATFDSLGRMATQVGANAQTTTYSYDNNGNNTGITNPLSKTQTNNFDVFNRFGGFTDFAGAGHGLTLDTQDNVTQSSLNINTTSYSYNGFGQMTQVVSLDTGTTTYTLDLAGNRVSETDARGIVTNRVFDALDRVATQTYPASTGENIAYYYDATGSGFHIGRLAGVTDESGSTFVDYNERGDVVKDSRVIAGVTYPGILYSYDLADHLTGITYPSGHSITYTRGATGQVTGITYTPGTGTPTTLLSNVSYLSMGPQYYTMTYGNGLLRNLTWDQDLRLVDIVTKNSGNTFLAQNLTLAYDAADNVTAINDWLDTTRSQTGITYDPDYRLTGATGKYGTLSYTYDNAGNRRSKTENGVSSTYGYSSSGNNYNQLLSVTTAGTTRTLTYTANGNVATDTGDANFTYSNRNRMKQSVSTGGQTSTYLYNAMGQLVQRNANGSVKQFLYDRKGHLIAEYSGAGSLYREYVYLGDQPIAQIETYGNNLYYIHTDHLGTPQKMTDPSQNIIWDRIQKPFGETYSVTGSINWFLRFPGQYADTFTNTNQNYFRDYDWSTGRYIEADPIGLAGGWNVFTYANGNPVRYIDPRGKNASSMTLLLTSLAIAMNLIEWEQEFQHPEKIPLPDPTPPPLPTINNCSANNPFGLPQQNLYQGPLAPKETPRPPEPEELDEFPEYEAPAPAR